MSTSNTVDSVHMPPANKSIVILGMHRSGTSAVAGALASLGVAPGGRLLSAQEDNRKGFWERKDVVRINDELLSALGSSWHDTRPLPADWWRQDAVASFKEQLLAVLRRDFASSPLWLVKDPRLCRLLPLYVQLFAELGVQPHFVLALRQPVEVARSLSKRDGMTTERANLLWLTHTLAAERGTRGRPRTFVCYQALLDDWRGEIGRMAAELGISVGLGQPELEARAAAFLAPDLRHQRARVEDVSDGPLSGLATECYRLLQAPARGNAIEARLAALQQEVDAAVRAAAPWEGELQAAAVLRKNLEERLAGTRSSSQVTIASLDEELRWVKQSRSWRYTRPFRFPAAIRRLLRRDRHKYDYAVDLEDHNTVAPKVVRLVGEDRRVLEVGAGPGTITRLLSQHNRCRVTAVEIDEDAIRRLAPLCENVFRCDLNDASWVWKVAPEGPFQVIVVADVLEHLYDPWTTLRAMAPLLDQAGEVIVSLPHIGHNAAIASIAGGSFDYGDWGLLDRTHIKFFGIRNIQSLINNAGYKIVAAEFVTKHPTETEFADAWLRAPSALKRALADNPFGAVYQVVVKARLDSTDEKGIDLTSLPVPSVVSAWRDWASS